ncbi:hypothetical protein AAVH_24070 [Aphelenchoides avenae]|nr:hypothetical protein AAVH_24070 [Aphelenchus avenae]
MRARRLVLPLTLWAALIVAVAPFSLRGVYDNLFQGFLGQSEPEQPPTSAAVENPYLEAHSRFKRCATTCDQSIVVQGPPTLEGTVDGIYRVFSSTTNGCTTLRITCTGLDPHGMTVLSVALPDDIGIFGFVVGAGPIVMNYECGDDGKWMIRYDTANVTVTGEFYCESYAPPPTSPAPASPTTSAGWTPTPTRPSTIPGMPGNRSTVSGAAQGISKDEHLPA